ncbi:jg19576, partial [Pararge aegeria aegeria]
RQPEIEQLERDMRHLACSLAEEDGKLKLREAVIAQWDFDVTFGANL